MNLGYLEKTELSLEQLLEDLEEQEDLEWVKEEDVEWVQEEDLEVLDLLPSCQENRSNLLLLNSSSPSSQD